MNRTWEERKRANEQIVREIVSRSPVLSCLYCADLGRDWQTVVAFHTKTLVRDGSGSIRREGPVTIGIHYRDRYLSEAPHPAELATVLEPRNVFHPNCGGSGAICLGHPAPGISLELILHQLWAGLTFNMKAVNTRPGQILNAEAAIYVRASANQFPITRRGLFEEPDDDWQNSDWHVRFDPRTHPLDIGTIFDSPNRGTS